MKLFTTLALALALTLPTLACLRVHGGITHDPLPGLSGEYAVEAIDNGRVVCSDSMGSRIDQDGHYSAWDHLERRALFRIYDHASAELNDAHHLATMTAPPPREFPTRSSETGMYLDENGKWRGTVPLLAEKTLEALAASAE
ncbi:MAG: hypothetical protein M1829_003788 [Trizodia sp. TS-e1964]|nr:MAG: hypothetical protein M1829_003788 [Trizodia sp. TS-e1964]